MRSNERFDVIIVGAGPSGSVCAEHLAARGARVLLVDKKSPGWHKPCGGGIPSSILRKFGVPLSLGFETSGVRIVDRRARESGFPLRPGASAHAASAAAAPPHERLPAAHSAAASTAPTADGMVADQRGRRVWALIEREVALQGSVLPDVFRNWPTAQGVGSRASRWPDGPSLRGAAARARRSAVAAHHGGKALVTAGTGYLRRR